MPGNITNPNNSLQILQALHNLDTSMRSAIERLNSLERRMTNTEDSISGIKYDISACDKAIREFTTSVLGVLSASQKGLADTLSAQTDEHRTSGKTDSKIRLILIIGIVITGLSLALERLGYDLQVNMDGIQLKHHDEPKDEPKEDK
jgi:hypothetical protein